MPHYVGLDVSVKETAVCIIDEAGAICRETKVVSHPEDLVQLLSADDLHVVRIGLEAGPLSQWLFNGLAQAGLPAICIETRHRQRPIGRDMTKTDTAPFWASTLRCYASAKA